MTVGQILFRETIYALSSGRLPAGVAVIRLSGPHSRFVLESLAGVVPPPRQMHHASFRDESGGVIDKGLCVFFEGPRSFTGEDCAELHLHGGKAVVAAMLDRLGRMEGLRHAEAGEFTRRAHLHGKMDLPAAEALADLIDAETEAQRRFALANADGRQGRLYMAWRRRILTARAMIEAELDFSDEGDVPGSVADEVWSDMAALAEEIGVHLEKFHYAEIIREGFKVVILGAPNVGKSSLLNALAARDVAIVTDEPGTTRDLLEVSLDLGGVKVVLTDTAGIRDDPGRVEAIGIARAQSAAENADLVILTAEGTASLSYFDGTYRDAVRLGTKSDLLAPDSRANAAGAFDLLISAKTGEGMADFIEMLRQRASAIETGSGMAIPSTRRHVDLLMQCRGELSAAVNGTAGLEIRAEELRRAGDALGRITGMIGVEDILGEIFSRFCIGK